jgi:glucose/arabinose dehydrogenase
MDAHGDLWITRGFAGKITKIDINNGAVVGTREVLSGLTIPHGIVFDPDNSNIVYVAEETKISRADTSASTLTLEKIADLPANGGHRTRTLTMGPDKRLYVSIGSSCNACNEQNPVRSTIYSLNRDGSDMREYANGLRNPVFSAWHPTTHELWSIDMGRDNLGDDIPPDEINIIREGQNYGWPICYGQKIHDTAFDKNVYVRDPCADTTAPVVDLPAHVSPLGITFVPHTWPQAYWDDLLVAEHGSSSRNPPVGYKIVRVKLDSQGRPSGTEDFITGWTHGSRPQDAYGRPVGILITSNGTTYISDDSKGNIYRLSIIR